MSGSDSGMVGDKTIEDYNRLLKEENELLKKEKGRLQLENSRLVLIGKSLQEEKHGYQKMVDNLAKRMELMTTIQKELEDKFTFKFEMMKMGVQEILQDVPDKRMDVIRKVKDWLNNQQPSMFMKGTCIEEEEDQLADVVDSLLLTLEKTGDPGSEDSTTMVTTEDTETFIKTVGEDQADSQKFAKKMKEKIASCENNSQDATDVSSANDSTEDLIKWEALEDPQPPPTTTTTATTEDSSAAEVTTTPGSGSTDQFVLIRVPDNRGKGKSEWKYVVGKLLSQAKILKSKDGLVIGKIFKVDYYKRQIAWDSFQPFKLNEGKKGYVVDEEDIVLKLPTPFNVSRQRLVRFDFNFKDYDVPF